ncbi:hypothetical protein FHW77_005282 [Agrobacterium sp. RC10-4-1]|uniref:hypothetical protein n=1 Tax=Agrobacterium sp. RC10-4-1 TaxID=2587039 RepID=UPI0015FC798F|nr:hypothetical protein [Agrobacterium sp. RC10-4-1]MBA8801526.1 hypothetical protein [Agrobacterium sp. RC10-4-1]
MRDHQAEQKKVDRVRYLADRLAGDQWVVETDNERVHLVAFRHMDEATIIATFSKDALSHEIELVALGLDVARLLLDVGERAGKIIAALRRALGREDRKEREKNYAANAAITAKEPSFWRFLEATTAGGQVRTQTAADTRLKSVLAISSKNQLNEDTQAARRWLDLRRAYENWKG